MHAQKWMAAALGVVLLIATIEGLVLTLRKGSGYDWRAYATTIGDMIGRRAIDALGIALATPAIVWAYDHRLTTVILDTAWAWVLLFVGQEFFYYWYHRTSHTVRWFWATHAVHHSPNQLTLAAALRLGWTGKLTGTTVFFVPLVWLGFPPDTVLGIVGLNLLYQFWIHAPWLPRMGPLEWVLNTPAHHSIHHASNTEYLDCNYGGVLIVFDRLFGTFVEAQPGVVIRYGLTDRIDSYNPFKIEFDAWVKIWKDLRNMPHWYGCFAVLFGPLGGPKRSDGDNRDVREETLL